MIKAELSRSRKIVERIVVEGELLLETPTRFGNGDQNGLVDLTLARDPLEGHALLPGASIAGALRSYLRTREIGFRNKTERATLERLLFGIEEKRSKEVISDQSSLIAYDALCREMATELRDGVALDPATRTARDKQKYDLELLAAGARFPLRIELLVRAGQEDDLRRALVMALQGFERGEIPMGARRRRGFGQCKVTQWRVRRYDLCDPKGLLAWLSQDTLCPPTSESGHVAGKEDEASEGAVGNKIAALLNVTESTLDRRNVFTVEATLGVAGSLLIRSSSEAPGAPDMVHLSSRRNGKQKPVLSGTTLAGALRARALRIARTVGDHAKAVALIDDLFGPQMQKHDTKPAASRLWAAESEIEEPLDLVVNRVKIDRFTGGSFPTALFSQQPVYGKPATQVVLKIHIHNATPADKGLLLLLLKDLWTQDLPLGGEASVGRGRLQGKSACITDQADGKAQHHWSLQQAAEKLIIEGDRTTLQKYVDQFCQEVQA